VKLCPIQFISASFIRLRHCTGRSCLSNDPPFSGLGVVDREFSLAWVASELPTKPELGTAVLVVARLRFGCSWHRKRLRVLAPKPVLPHSRESGLKFPDSPVPVEQCGT